MDPERASTDEVESNAPIPAEGTVPSDVNVSERPASDRQGGGAREAFFQAMTDWFAEFVRTNPAVRPPPPQDSQVPHVASPAAGIFIRERPPVDKIRKQGAEEFRATKDDDAEKAKFWLENTIRVFEELSCTPEECMKCVVSLLRDSAYHWWKTLVSIVPKVEDSRVLELKPLQLQALAVLDLLDRNVLNVGDATPESVEQVKMFVSDVEHPITLFGIVLKQLKEKK
ncbi:uncharacterized protein [Gossypium hirsutum]|uniref:Protein MCM10 homolog n=1 Tax=Gossypium hirsutum TaxID=3635 RepID=A0ABM3A042_GOSHI|nr:uncharacterized protein LOC121216737 [Gossypium hirsutum]